jgi:hypothetical protein
VISAFTGLAGLDLRAAQGGDSRSARAWLLGPVSFRQVLAMTALQYRAAVGTNYAKKLD